MRRPTWLLPDLDDRRRRRRSGTGCARGELLVQACASCGAAAHAAAADVPALPVDRRRAGSRRRAAARSGRSSSPIRRCCPRSRSSRRTTRSSSSSTRTRRSASSATSSPSADGEINEIDPATIAIGEPVRVVFHRDRRRDPPPLGQGLDSRRPPTDPRPGKSADGELGGKQRRRRCDGRRGESTGVTASRRWDRSDPTVELAGSGGARARALGPLVARGCRGCAPSGADARSRSLASLASDRTWRPGFSSVVVAVLTGTSSRLVVMTLRVNTLKVRHCQPLCPASQACVRRGLG